MNGALLAHGGTAGLVIELSSAIAVALLLLWATVRSRRGHED